MAFVMSPVSSSNLVAAGYDPVREVLRVEFDNGSQYDYPNVDPELYAAFLAAPSQGKYLHGVIKPGRRATKVGG